MTQPLAPDDLGVGLSVHPTTNPPVSQNTEHVIIAVEPPWIVMTPVFSIPYIDDKPITVHWSSPLWPVPETSP